MPAFSFQTVDIPPALTALSPSAPATGFVIATLPPAPAPYWWQVIHVTLSSTSSALTTANLYLDTNSPANFRGGSSSGNSDFLDFASPLLVPANRQLICQWAGMSLGAIGTIVVEYLLVQLTPASATKFLAP